MNALQVNIIAYADDWQPGWIKCCFGDIHKKEWVIIEKVPAIASSNLDKNSPYPINELIECTVLERSANAAGEKIVTIDLNKPPAFLNRMDRPRSKFFEEQVKEIF